MTIRIRFSLRVLLALVLLTAVPLAWWVNSSMRQQRAVVAIRKMGGQVWYEIWPIDFQRPQPKVKSSYQLPSIAPDAPAWAMGVLGPDFFYRVGSVDFYGTVDETIEPLKCLRRLRSVYGVDLTDDDKKKLREVLPDGCEILTDSNGY